MCMRMCVYVFMYICICMLQAYVCALFICMRVVYVCFPFPLVS
jgi:hypothetical protein